ncbi:hypothetical protein AVEN_86736-1 [Araneus ventricosus]|uniref:Uncharacterized protein n=1 Tax=Araneus ventricosus TaxID=182803 RepID=A0A4Y2JE08_ARAVE|nr:hypothetical protein AVEN_86736-1 [Araneus ventricosus]
MASCAVAKIPRFIQQRESADNAGVYDLSVLYRLRDGSQIDVIIFRMDVNLFGKEYVCCKCGEKMVLCERNDIFDGFNWVCRKSDHYIKRTVRKGSWFDCSRLSIPEILIISYLWVKKTTND